MEISVQYGLSGAGYQVMAREDGERILFKRIKLMATGLRRFKISLKAVLTLQIIIGTLASGQSYDDFRSGAAAVSFAIENGGKSLSREQQDNFLIYSIFMRGFLFGVRNSSSILKSTESEKMLVPDEWMYNPGKSAPSFLAFAAKHQPEEFDSSKIDTEGLTLILVAWYLDAHSKTEDALGASPEELTRLKQLNSTDKVTSLSDVDLRKLIVGRWTTGRHDYEYLADGTWRMLPADKDTTKGNWRIENHKLIEDTEMRTIIECNHNIIVMKAEDGGYPYRYVRIEDDPR